MWPSTLRATSHVPRARQTQRIKGRHVTRGAALRCTAVKAPVASREEATAAIARHSSPPLTLLCSVTAPRAISEVPQITDAPTHSRRQQTHAAVRRHTQWRAEPRSGAQTHATDTRVAHAASLVSDADDIANGQRQLVRALRGRTAPLHSPHVLRHAAHAAPPHALRRGTTGGAYLHGMRGHRRGA